MIKKIIVSSTLLVLLFETFYFSSNNKSLDLTYGNTDDVYKIAINDIERDKFLNEYSNIILTTEDDLITVMTSKNIIDDISSNYNVVIN